MHRNYMKTQNAEQRDIYSQEKFIKKIPLVTVLLLTYNHKDSFKKAVESVLEQKTDFGVQIIILDDASTDGTSEIVQKYKEYENINVIIRNKNIGSKFNLYAGLKLVKTPFYAVLETDDYWCDENKLQIQVNILKDNPDCSFCAHNTDVHYAEENKIIPYINKQTQKFYFPKIIRGKYYIEPHISSRLYRSMYLDFKTIKDPLILISDITSNFYYLTKGNMYYIDKIMSVYNYTGKGIYSGVSAYRQRYKSANNIYKLNLELNFRYNKLLSRFFSTRINLNPLTYLKLKYTQNPEKLLSLYEKILENYKNNYLSNMDIKPIFKMNIPINKNKRLALELKRESSRVRNTV